VTYNSLTVITPHLFSIYCEVPKYATAEIAGSTIFHPNLYGYRLYAKSTAHPEFVQIPPEELEKPVPLGMTIFHPLLHTSNLHQIQSLGFNQSNSNEDEPRVKEIKEKDEVKTGDK
jgi:hypothetical protein